MESIEPDAVKSATVEKDMIELLGSRGTMEILCVFCCSQKRVRFTELSHLFKHISTKTLASRLRELEQKGILSRTAYNEIPPRVEYSMTDKGQALAEALIPLVNWMSKWTSEKEMAGGIFSPQR
jgi:DNA-binding HxlR family transcriptional regulator